MRTVPMYIETHYLTDFSFMCLVFDLSKSEPVRTHVYKKVNEPNLFDLVIDVAGDVRQIVFNERDKRVKG